MSEYRGTSDIDDRVTDPSVPAFLQWPGEAAAQIANADWGAVGFLPVDRWPQSLQAVVGMMLRTTVPMVLLWGEQGLMIYNDGYAPLTQGINKMALPVAEAWPEIADWNLSMLAKVRAGGTDAFKNMEMVLHRGGREDTIYFNLDYSPVLDDDGSIGGMMVVVVETTDDVIAERIRAKEERRQRKMLDQMPGFAAVLTGPEHVFAYVNDAYLEIGGIREYLGRTVRDVFPELEGQGFYELLDQVYRSGERYTASGIPLELSHNSGKSFVDLLYEPIRDDDDNVIGIFVGGYNSTETHLGAAKLAEREAFLSGVLRSSTDCIKVLDLDGRLTFMSEGGQKVMEVDDFSKIEKLPWPGFWEGEGNRHAAVALEAARSGQTYHFIGEAKTYKGTHKWWNVSVSPILDNEGQPSRILSVSRDMTDLVAAQQQQQLLNAELGHRLKNLLAMVQSIAAQTLNQATDIEEASNDFGARLAAFGKATDVLTATSWTEADLSDVVDAGLAAVQAFRERVSITGDAITLPSQAALALTLVIHELATNAAKYGALSVPGGRVDIQWQKHADDHDADRFRFEWIESSGPTVVPPSSRGFGSRMIERSLNSYFSGGTSLTFDPAGVRFVLDSPIERVKPEQG